MNCNQVEHLLQGYIDADLSEALSTAVEKHHKACSACNNSYLKAIQINALLKEMPVPPPSEGFVDRVLDKATQETGSQKSSMPSLFAGAIAAGFALWFVATSTIFAPPVTAPAYANTITVNSEVKTIKVAINSEAEFDSVKMSIELSPNLEIAGYGNRTSINWDTRLKKGVNVIKLPIVGLASGEGKITTRVQMNGKEKIMQIQTNYEVPGNVWYQPNSPQKV